MEEILSIILFFVGLFYGRHAERKHLRELDAREAVLFPQFRLDTRRRVSSPATIAGARLVSGSCVIGTDGAKSFFIKCRNLVGGEHKSIRKMVERGRREAVLRMLQDAQGGGAAEIWNIRFDTSHVGGPQALQVEVMAYGTAIRRLPA